MAEYIEHPGCGWVTAQDVALVANAVDRVPDRCFRTREVGVRLVVVAAHELEPALPEQAPQLVTPMRMSVEVGLEVVDLGEYELVVWVLPGHVQVQADELERGAELGEPAVLIWQQQPALGELALGVPPHWVVVEVADHPHRPARHGRDDLCAGLRPGWPALRDYGRLPAGALGDGCRESNTHLRDILLAGAPRAQPGGLGGAHGRAFDAYGHRAIGGSVVGPVGGRIHRVYQDRDPNNLHRTLHGPGEKLGRLNGRDPHRVSLRRRSASWAGARVIGHSTRLERVPPASPRRRPRRRGRVGGGRRGRSRKPGGQPLPGPFGPSSQAAVHDRIRTERTDPDFGHDGGEPAQLAGDCGSESRGLADPAAEHDQAR